MPRLPTWIIAIGVIVVLQTTSAYLTRLIPIISPPVMAEFRWDESWVGYLSAANTVGALFLVTAAIGVFRAMGGVRALLVSLIVGGASLLLFYVPLLWVALFASVLIGLSNGAANPAGSEVLQRFTPQAHRNVVFSIKQAGVPLGGVIAGLSVPLLVEAAGWRVALLVAAIASIALTLAMWPFQKQIDPPRDPMLATRWISFRLTDIAVPIRALSRGQGLWRMSWVGCLLAIPQACWVTFTVTYLVVALGTPLTLAGLVFAVMQASSVFGRIFLGWVADHVLSSTKTLAVASFASAISTMLLGLSTTAWPAWALILLAAVAGIAASGWNGVQIAEVARRSPPELIAESAAGSVILIYGSNMLAPVAFAVFVALTGRFDYAFLISGAFSLICLPLLYGIDRTPAR